METSYRFEIVMCNTGQFVNIDMKQLDQTFFIFQTNVVLAQLLIVQAKKLSYLFIILVYYTNYLRLTS